MGSSELVVRSARRGAMCTRSGHTMSVPSASYSVTIRVELDQLVGVGAVTRAVGIAGGSVIALDVVESHGARMVVDLTCNAIDEGHSDRLRAAVEEVEGAHVPRAKRPHLPSPSRRNDLDRTQSAAKDSR